MPYTQQLYRHIASLLLARENCQKSNNAEWFEKHGDRIDDLCEKHLPAGSGFDSGTLLDYQASKPERLVFSTSFHHMNEQGSYDGWTDHQVIVTPSLVHGFELRITGKNRNDIKDYIAETFHTALTQSITL